MRLTTQQIAHMVREMSPEQAAAMRMFCAWNRKWMICTLIMEKAWYRLLTGCPNGVIIHLSQQGAHYESQDSSQAS
jgi:hypothetical protein